MKNTIHILLVEDNKTDAALIEQYLSDADISFCSTRVDNEEDYLLKISDQPDIIVSDYMLPQFDGLRALALLKQAWLDIPFVLISGKIGEETAVELIKAGANNFVSKNNLSRLPTIILHEIEEAKVRKQLSDLQEQYEKLVTLSPDAIFIQCDKKFVFVNQAGCKLLGAQASNQIIGRNIYEFFHPNDHEKINDRIQKIESEKKVAEIIEEKMIDLNGRIVDVEVLAAPFNYEGKPASQVFVRNISDRKQAEKKVKLQSQKIKRQIKRNKELEYADVIKSEFMATLSHELRSPLNAIIGFSELLKEGLVGKLSDKQAQYSKDIYNAGQHLLALINDMLDMSKIDAGKMHCDLEEVDMIPFLQETILLMKDKATSVNVQLKIDISNKIVQWEIDRRRFKQIIYNLLSNAIKFTSNGGMIKFQANINKNNELEITISDTGQGMSEKELENLFQPFMQTVASEKSREKGTGLGLVIAKQLVELHEGSIFVKSQPGNGTCFTLTFPKREHSLLQKIQETIHFENEWFPLALVVEDDPKAAELLGIYLKELKIEMIWKTSAEEALGADYENIPNFIILDILLPGMSGIEMMSALKEHPILSQVPILITSIAVTENKSAVIQAADFLQKPIHRRELIASITKIANQHASEKTFNILIADDELASFEVVKASLGDLHCQLEHVRDGEEALKHIQNNPPDLLILDLLMPKMDGFEVLDSLKKLNFKKEIPVIVITSKVLSYAEKMLLKNSVVNIMQKKTKLKEQLQREIKRMILN